MSLLETVINGINNSQVKLSSPGFQIKGKKKRQNIQKLAFKYGKFLYVLVPCVNIYPIHVIPVQFEFNEYT